jgi:hypothetical protein
MNFDSFDPSETPTGKQTAEPSSLFVVNLTNTFEDCLVVFRSAIDDSDKDVEKSGSRANAKWKIFELTRRLDSIRVTEQIWCRGWVRWIGWIGTSRQGQSSRRNLQLRRLDKTKRGRSKKIMRCWRVNAIEKAKVAVTWTFSDARKHGCRREKTLGNTL